MSPINSLWFKWKSLRLPWRKSFLAGSDLAGNTYWEFKETLNATRFRRIVKFDPKTHYADVQVSPQWHQWLRYVRPEPPSLLEQQQDVIRQMQIKQLARAADERWASKPSYIDTPKTQQPGPAMQTSDATLKGPSESAQRKQAEGTKQTAAAPPPPPPQQQQQTQKSTNKEDPWQKAKAGNPGDSWQPEAWTPTAARR